MHPPPWTPNKISYTNLLLGGPTTEDAKSWLACPDWSTFPDPEQPSQNLWFTVTSRNRAWWPLLRHPQIKRAMTPGNLVDWLGQAWRSGGSLLHVYAQPDDPDVIQVLRAWLEVAQDQPLPQDKSTPSPLLCDDRYAFLKNTTTRQLRRWADLLPGFYWWGQPHAASSNLTRLLVSPPADMSSTQPKQILSRLLFLARHHPPPVAYRPWMGLAATMLGDDAALQALMDSGLDEDELCAWWKENDRPVLRQVFSETRSHLQTIATRIRLETRMQGGCVDVPSATALRARL